MGTRNVAYCDRMSADPHRTTSGRDLVMDGLFGAGLALASGMTLRWMGAESAGTVVLALAAAPIGGALGYVLRATLASSRPSARPHRP